jgi:hypothetical protein
MFQELSRIIQNHNDYSRMSPQIYKNHPECGHSGQKSGRCDMGLSPTSNCPDSCPKDHDKWSRFLLNNSWWKVSELCPRYLANSMQKLGLVCLGLYDVSTMPLRLFTIASRLVRNTSRMPKDSFGLVQTDCFKNAQTNCLNMSKPIVLKMFKTFGSACRSFRNDQEPPQLQ